MIPSSAAHVAPLPAPETLRAALRQVVDPEAGINIVDLGLIYRLSVAADRTLVRVEMTMTSPACPMGETIAEEVERVLRQQLPGDSRIEVALAWEPPWSPDCMTPEARRHFGW